MTQAHTKGARENVGSPPAPVGDFYRIIDVLDSGQRAPVLRVRAYMEREVAPTIEEYWARALRSCQSCAGSTSEGLDTKVTAALSAVRFRRPWC
jgi:hypothetical protein